MFKRRLMKHDEKQSQGDERNPDGTATYLHTEFIPERAHKCVKSLHK
jgi:hypothetical protein